MQIDKQMKVNTLDIKYLFVNLPIHGILTTTKFWLNRNIHDNELIKQTLHILEIIMKHNYFLYNQRFLQPDKGIAMGSPVSSTMAEVYLQYIEETYLKQWLENKKIVYYKHYVDDILIIYDQNKTNKQTVLEEIYKIDQNLQFKISTEENNTINYLDITIHRNNNNVDISIYRKPTGTDTTIQFSSNHPYEHKIAAFKYYIHRMLTLPITEESKQEEWKTIITMAKNNGYPIGIINDLRTKLISRKHQQHPPPHNSI